MDIKANSDVVPDQTLHLDASMFVCSSCPLRARMFTDGSHQGIMSNNSTLQMEREREVLVKPWFIIAYSARL